MIIRPFPAILFLAALPLASCKPAPAGEKPVPPFASGAAFEVEEIAEFDEPWAMDFDELTGALIVSERAGTIKLRWADGTIGQISGVPKVAYGGQGGLGDAVFGPGQAGGSLNGRVVYLSWAEAGPSDTRGAAVGRGTLSCTAKPDCALTGLKVIWRQVPKVTGEGHYSHRIAFSPDGQYLFVSSGDRQKFDPAQDLTGNLGKILRLLPDGTPAPGNPFADKPAPTNQIWSYGHRNVLGLTFDAQGQLWDLEHGPAGGDEINRIEPGKNYGWPLVSDGDHYDGRPIPRHATRPDLAGPAISWNPVIAPGDMIVYTGNRFPAWKGDFLIAALGRQALVQVHAEGGTAREVARYAFDDRLREIDQGPDGMVWLLEDGGGLLRLVPKAP
jgi:glucose/arabinose dehydrogenase